MANQPQTEETDNQIEWLGDVFQKLVESLGSTHLGARLDHSVAKPMREAWDYEKLPGTNNKLKSWATAAEAIEAWKEVRANLEAWNEVKPNLEKVAGWEGVNWAEPLEACNDALNSLKQRNANAGIASPMVLHMQWDQKVFDEAEDALIKSQRLFNDLANRNNYVDPGVDWAKVVHLREQADLRLKKLGDVWVPMLLLQLPGGPQRLLEFIGKGQTWAQLGHFNNRRLWLAKWAAEQAKPEEASPVQDWINIILKPENFQATLLREPGPRGLEDDWEVEEYPDLERGVAARVVLKLRREKKEGRLLKGIWRKPPDRPRLTVALSLAARALRAEEGELAGLCDKVAAFWPKGDPGAWWASALAEQKSQVWRLIQLLSLRAVVDPPLPSLVAVLQEFEEAGFQLESPPKNMSYAESQWLLLPAEAPGKLPRARGGPALKGPDGQLLMPALWFHLPPAQRDIRPLVRCLLELEPLVALLGHSKPVWWATALPVWWATALTDAVRDLANCRELFEHCFRLFREAPDEADRNIGRNMTLRVYECLIQELGDQVFPPIDASGNLLSLPSWPVGTIVHWDTQSRQPRGELVNVVRFGYGGSPGEVWLSAGPDLPVSLRAWLSLPDPPFPELVGEDFPPLDWSKRTKELVVNPAKADAAETAAKDRFQDWVANREGRDWFDALCRGGPGPAADWLRVLRERGWCNVFPVPIEGGYIWPADVPFGDIHWEWNDSLPPGRVILAERFGARADIACCWVSLGSRANQPGLSAFWDLRAAVKSTPWLADLLGEPFEAEWTKSLTRCLRLGGGQGPSPLDIVRPLEALSGEVDPVRRREIDQYLARVREWCKAEGLTLLPEGDALFSTPPSAVATREFGKGLPGTLLALRFGLRRGRDLLEPATICLSSGPAPAGYFELLKFLKESREPKAKKMIGHMLEWPGLLTTEGVDLQVLAGRLFKEFYQEGMDTWEAGRGDKIGQLLGNLVESTGFTLFEPAVHDPCGLNWECVNENGQEGRATSMSRVRRVIMPGLERDGELVLLPKVVASEMQR